MSVVPQLSQKGHWLKFNAGLLLRLHGLFFIPVPSQNGLPNGAPLQFRHRISASAQAPLCFCGSGPNRAHLDWTCPAGVDGAPVLLPLPCQPPCTPLTWFSLSDSCSEWGGRRQGSSTVPRERRSMRTTDLYSEPGLEVWPQPAAETQRHAPAAKRRRQTTATGGPQ